MKRAKEMRAVFARHKESGLTLKAFGEREGIAYTTLQYWRRRLRDDEAPALSPSKGEPVSLAPVRVVADTKAPEPPARGFDIWLSNGVSLEVPSGFDEGDLRRLVGVLSTC